MNKFVLILLVSVFFLSGCSTTGSGYYPHSSSTRVTIDKNNYKMVRPNAIGTSNGFLLLGFITIKDPKRTDAMTELYEDAGIKAGGAYALINVVEEDTRENYILFSRPVYTIRADIVEFIDEKKDEK